MKCILVIYDDASGHTKTLGLFSSTELAQFAIEEKVRTDCNPNDHLDPTLEDFIKIPFDIDEAGDWVLA